MPCWRICRGVSLVSLCRKGRIRITTRTFSVLAMRKLGWEQVVLARPSRVLAAQRGALVGCNSKTHCAARASSAGARPWARRKAPKS